MRNQLKRIGSSLSALFLVVLASACFGQDVGGGVQDAGEQVVEFGDDCRGWRIDGEEDCTLLSVSECATENRCEVESAFRQVAEAGCYELLRICVNRPPVTTPDQTYYLAPDGTCFQFGSSTDVPGWFVPDEQTNCCPEVVICEDES